jgi:hypothetical protein
MDNIYLLAIALAAGLVACILVLWRRRPRLITPQAQPTRDPVESEFANVFFNKTKTDRERIVALWMTRKKCSRLEAMRFAVDDWRKDQRTWR